MLTGNGTETDALLDVSVMLLVVVEMCYYERPSATIRCHDSSNVEYIFLLLILAL